MKAAPKLLTRLRACRLLRNERAQGMIEMALVLPILLLLIGGIIDFGFIFTGKIGLENSARNGARYATTHPTAWSNASAAPINSIEGVIQGAGGSAHITNDDTHIDITYLSASTGLSCGSYSASAGVFTPSNQQATCVVPGNLIQVKVTYTYNLITPIIRNIVGGGSVTFSSTATMVEEQ